jgi:hypothetical protein
MRRVEAADKNTARRGRGDSADTYGVRGGGAVTWQARWGMPLNELDLDFAVRREPICKRTVVDVAYDMFAKGFTVEEISEKPDPAWSREVSKVLDGLNAKACLTRLFLYERLFGWSILALTYVDYGKNPTKPVQGPREIRELMPYSSFQCIVESSDEDRNPKSLRFGLPEFYRIRRADLFTVLRGFWIMLGRVCLFLRSCTMTKLSFVMLVGQ